MGERSLTALVPTTSKDTTEGFVTQSHVRVVVFSAVVAVLVLDMSVENNDIGVTALET